ncbi:MAG TPA: SAM-dependent chlorinase/fluorinase, partial [Candidatus Saccharicenans sp.]|nr:SAM-dependent chlorinase/fluorinase [Candidatus Saccharicenans sp.]
MGKKIIALLTDFGLKDYFVASLKGVILSINPEVSLVDITHDL